MVWCLINFMDNFTSALINSVTKNKYTFYKKGSQMVHRHCVPETKETPASDQPYRFTETTQTLTTVFKYYF
jgi:hypothetical protein